MYHFSIHSSIDGHLRCFHILAAVNNATMKIRMHVSFQINYIEKNFFNLKNKLCYDTLSYVHANTYLSVSF